ncbi:MAG TPA: HAMP domain-containing sensor histidine kinase [Xanthomonadaceae bacterium]|nr:HAMP domain-containing sensor histidine kinase [Xanthomonadaceae bacterium]
MQYRHRLRSRIVISFLLLGFGLTALFAAATLFLRARLESQLVEDWLAAETMNFLEFKRNYPEPEAEYGLSAQRIYLYAYRPDSPQIPFAWQELATGVHDIQERDEAGELVTYKLALRRASDMVVALKYSYEQQAVSQRQLMVALGIAVIAFTVLALAVGWWSSARVMRPVSDLVARVRAYRGERAPEPLAPHFAQDEVGELAQALDDYAARLTDMVQRDREFNADVSHELRTPLAVIRGATELLLNQPDLSEKSRLRLARIERAAQQSADLTEALLMLSRNERGSSVADVCRVAQQVAESNRAHLADKPVEIVVEGRTGVLIDAPESVLSVALGNLVGNACKYTGQGEVRIAVESDAVSVVDTGPGITAEDARRLFDRGYRGASAGHSKGAGIGLAIVLRLCELHGWRVSIAPRQDRTGTVARLEFATPKPRGR